MCDFKLSLCKTEVQFDQTKSLFRLKPDSPSLQLQNYTTTKPSSYETVQPFLDLEARENLPQFYIITSTLACIDFVLFFTTLLFNNYSCDFNNVGDTLASSTEERTALLPSSFRLFRWFSIATFLPGPSLWQKCHFFLEKWNCIAWQSLFISALVGCSMGFRS